MISKFFQRGIASFSRIQGGKRVLLGRSKYLPGKRMMGMHSEHSGKYLGYAILAGVPMLGWGYYQTEQMLARLESLEDGTLQKKYNRFTDEEWLELKSEIFPAEDEDDEDEEDEEGESEDAEESAAEEVEDDAAEAVAAEEEEVTEAVEVEQAEEVAEEIAEEVIEEEAVEASPEPAVEAVPEPVAVEEAAEDLTLEPVVDELPVVEACADVEEAVVEVSVVDEPEPALEEAAAAVEQVAELVEQLADGDSVVENVLKEAESLSSAEENAAGEPAVASKDTVIFLEADAEDE